MNNLPTCMEMISLRNRLLAHCSCMRPRPRTQESPVIIDGVDVMELVGVKNVVMKLPTRNPVSSVVCIRMIRLCSSPAGQAVESDSRSTHPQTLPDPPDSMTMVGKVDVIEVVVCLSVEQVTYCG